MAKYFKLKNELIKEENGAYWEMGIISTISKEEIGGIARYDIKPDGLKEITKEEYMNECVNMIRSRLDDTIAYHKRMIVEAEREYNEMIKEMI